MTRSRALAAAFLASVLLAAGCRARRAAAPAPPPRPVRAFTPPPPLVPALVVLHEPEVAETQLPVSVLPPPAATTRFPPPPPVRRRRGAPAAKPAPEPEEPTPPEPQAAPAIHLGEVLPAALARQLEQRLAEHTASARRVLDSIGSRRLSRSQADLAARIRAFLRQSERMRARDLAAAAELSRRAALLAQELERSLR